MERHMPLVRALEKAVLTGHGETDTALRQMVAGHAAEVGGGRPGAPVGALQDVPEVLRAYVDKVSRHAYKVVDRDLEELKEAGYSEDAIFEITVSAALGAGLSRLERGLAALRGEE